MKIVVLLRAAHPDPTSRDALPWLGPCDRAALGTALALKRAEDSLVAVTAGGASDNVCLELALAAGVPRAIRLCEGCLDDADLRTLCGLMAGALYKIGFDLVLTGQRSADWGSGAVGPALAHFLGLPHVTSVIGVERGDAGLCVEHLREGEIVSLEMKPPALLAIAEGPARPLPTVADPHKVELMDLEDSTLRIPKLTDAGPTAPAPAGERQPVVLSSARALLLELKNAGLTR